MLTGRGGLQWSIHVSRLAATWCSVCMWSGVKTLKCVRVCMCVERRKEGRKGGRRHGGGASNTPPLHLKTYRKMMKWSYLGTFGNDWSVPILEDFTTILPTEITMHHFPVPGSSMGEPFDLNMGKTKKDDDSIKQSKAMNHCVKWWIQGGDTPAFPHHIGPFSPRW